MSPPTSPAIVELNAGFAWPYTFVEGFTATESGAFATVNVCVIVAAGL